MLFNFSDIEEQMNVSLISKYGIQFGIEVETMLRDLDIDYTPILDERWQ